ncbi:MAG: biosynthetic-type acetolactate synthase large subunit [Marinilabilia sp.]
MKMTGAEIIVRMLEQKGITKVAGIPGAANLHLYHALKDSRIRHVLARHEQGAGFMAQGIARTTGQTGVCFTTSGPGSTNLLTAIADAKLDSIPVVAITGQVATAAIGTDAFQEIDTYGLTIPITKHNFLVRTPEELLSVIPEAFHIAESGRPGPVVIDIPKDVQQQTCMIDKLPEFKNPEKGRPVTKEEATEISKKINQAKRPVILAGGGVNNDAASEMLLKLAEINNIPVTYTMRGIGAFPPDHPLSMGMIGMHGTRYANAFIEEADLVIAVGARFDDRATGVSKNFISQSEIIHVDIDASEINKIKKANYSLNASAEDVLDKILPLIEQDNRPEWSARLRELKKEMPYVSVPDDAGDFHPLRIIHNVACSVPKDSIITTDVGQHQMWVAQTWPFRQPRTFISSSGLGTMGFGVPAAIGAALANPDKKVVCFSGDGSILMNIQELVTLGENNLNVTILVFNNQSLGLVRQHQELFFSKNYMATQFEARPDFAAIAQAFGIPSKDLTTSSDPVEDLEKALRHQGPVLVNVPISTSENVLPMVKPGAPNKDMIY